MNPILSLANRGHDSPRPYNLYTGRHATKFLFTFSIHKVVVRTRSGITRHFHLSHQLFLSVKEGDNRVLKSVALGSSNSGRVKSQSGCRKVTPG